MGLRPSEHPSYLLIGAAITVMRIGQLGEAIGPGVTTGVGEIAGAIVPDAPYSTFVENRCLSLLMRSSIRVRVRIRIREVNEE